MSLVFNDQFKHLFNLDLAAGIEKLVVVFLLILINIYIRGAFKK